jgi:hypothetical protein
MEKTVLVIAANSLSGESCGQPLSLDLSLGKGKASSNTKTVPKSVWTCCVQGVVKYVRVTFDLFPDQRQVCVAAVDYTKCQPVNSWRDEDQELGKVLAGFQKFGQPITVPVTPPTGHTPTLLSPCIQGVQYGVRCLAQLTATQYAATTSPGHTPPSNQGRLILFCSLRSSSGIKDLEDILVRLVKSENSDIRQKGDPARLAIAQCQLVVVNSYTTPTSDVKDAPLTQLSSHVSSIVYSFPALLLVDKCLLLCQLHHDLSTTLITGIPMKEEQSGSGSASYDVELIHLSEAHRDILRGGFVLGGGAVGKKGEKEAKDKLSLKWSTPKTSSLELQPCTSAYRVSPTNVTSRPTICLVNFVLSGKPVLLEQPRKGTQKLITHVLMNHAGAVPPPPTTVACTSTVPSGSIYLHCIPSTRNHVEDPPSISEGWGGRITDYRISDFSELTASNMLSPIPEDRTKAPHCFPLQIVMSKLERESRHWPLVYADTLIYTLSQDLHPLPVVVRRDAMSEQDFEDCKKVIKSLQSKEAAGEGLSVPSTGTRAKGVKRDEQYRLMWSELESLTDTFRANSELHRRLAEVVAEATNHAPSMQLARKTPHGGGERSGDSNHWPPPGNGYRESGDRKGGGIGASGTTVWDQDRGNMDPRTQRYERGSGTSQFLPRPAPPIGSVAKIWAARQVLYSRTPLVAVLIGEAS